MLQYLDNITLDNIKSYRNAVIYFLKNKTIWYYDFVDCKGNEALCSFSLMPEFHIKGLGRIRYYDKNRNLIDSNYYTNTLDI